MESRRAGFLGVLWPMSSIVAGLGIIFFVSGLFTASGEAASLGSIRGLVKDSSGKPLRAARITARLGPRTITRFTDKTGRYRISDLKPDTYDVTATAWGFERKLNKKEVSGDAEMNFSLAPKWDVNQLTKIGRAHV